MKAKYLFLLMLFSLGLFSCKKDKTSFNTSVKVFTYNQCTHRFVPNVRVTLRELKRENSTSSSFIDLKSGLTDSNGEYDFGTIETHDNAKYTYVISSEYSNYTINKGENNIATVYNCGSAYINIKFTPPPPYNNFDSLVVSFHHEIYNYQFKKKNSDYVSTDIFYLYLGKYYVNIDKYKSSIYTNIKDTVFYYYEDSLYEYNLNW
jgi:hypothetical protein